MESTEERYALGELDKAICKKFRNYWQTSLQIPIQQKIKTL